MNAGFSTYSIVLLYSAIAVYAGGFVAYALDLARRTAERQPSLIGSPALVSVANGQGGSAEAGDRTGSETHSFPSSRPGPSARIALRLTIIAWVLQAAAVVLRGVSAGRVPWANMYEFSMTSTLIIVGVFLVAQKRFKLQFLGTFIVGLMLILLAIGTVGFYVAAIPLPPALQSTWLVIHVLVAMIATAFFSLSFALSALLVARTWQSRGFVFRKGSDGIASRILNRVPGFDVLDALAYRITLIGFILWTFTLMAGAIWAERAWGRYWGWDTKEVWTFIIWVVYAAYIHAKATRGWTGTRAAWLAIIGFGAVMFNFGIVNIFFKGLHSYSGL